MDLYVLYRVRDRDFLLFAMAVVNKVVAVKEEAIRRREASG
jgi:hypothetical protein